MITELDRATVESDLWTALRGRRAMWTARTAGAARHYDAITIVSAGAYLLLLFLIGYPRVAQVTDRVRGQGHQPTMLILKTVRE